MKAFALAVTVFACCMASVAVAQTFTVTAQKVGGGAEILVPYSATEPMIGTVEIQGALTTESNQGLAFFSYDLRVSGPRAVDLGTSTVFDPPLDPTIPGPGGEQPEVYTFHVPDGFSIWLNQVDDLFNGSPIGDNLVQLGGGQNTINNDPFQGPFLPFPAGPVILDLGHPGNEIIMHKFDIRLPDGSVLDDEYVLEPFNVVGNMITSFNGVNYTVDPVPVTGGVAVTLRVSDVCTDTTPPEIVHAEALPGETTPCTGYIDPRLESDNGVDVNKGLTEVVFVFTEPVQKVGGGTLDAANFTVTQTGAGTPPTVTGVSTTDDITFTLTLSGLPTLQEWTKITAVSVEDVVAASCSANPLRSVGDQGPGVPEPDRIDIAFLPGDMNQDGQVASQDLIDLRDYLTADSFHNACDDGLYFDTDRDGVYPEPQDLIRFRQSLSGEAPATGSWDGASVNNVQP